jgi:Tfp pilus assembly pilus retraction ATPase PilT
MARARAHAQCRPRPPCASGGWPVPARRARREQCSIAPRQPADRSLGTARERRTAQRASLRARCAASCRGADTKVTQPTRERLILPMLSADEKALLDSQGELDFSYTVKGLARFRVNVYRQLRGLDATLRRISLKPPTLADLNLPPAFAKFTNYHQGMVLITGPSSCGKSSTMAALVNLVNEERAEHILTVEDPIEYLHRSKRCIVNQRNV